MGALLMSVLIGGSVMAVRYLRPMVSVTEAVEGPVVQAFYATGTLQPDREFGVRSNVEGILTKMLVDKGDAVRKGQKVAFVSADDLQFKHKQAQADLELKQKLADEATSPSLMAFDAQIRATEQQVQIARREQTRVSDLLKRDAASQVDVDRAADRVQELLSLAESIRGQRGTKKLELDKDVVVAKAALDIAQWNLDQQTIRSPVDGVVLDRPVSQGMRVKVNDHVMQVADVSPANLVMRAAVDEEDKAQVGAKQAVRMTLYSFAGEVFQGQVKRIYPKADAERRTFEVDVAMTPPDPRFSAGMTGELAFIMAEKARAIVVPSQTVQNGAVWVVRDGQLVRVDVQLGLKSIERVEVISGLQPGDRVVISALDQPRPGHRVRTTFVDPVAAAGMNKPKDTGGAFRGFN